MKKCPITGQEIFEKENNGQIVEEVKCPVCGKLLDLRGNAWFDPYAEGGQKYTCHEHLSLQRVEEIKKRLATEYKEATKPWVTIPYTKKINMLRTLSTIDTMHTLRAAIRAHQERNKPYDDVRDICANYTPCKECSECEILFATRESDISHPNIECFKEKG